MSKTYKIETENNQTTITLSFFIHLLTSHIFRDIFAIDPATRMTVDLSTGQPLVIFALEQQQAESLAALKTMLEKEGFADCTKIVEPMPRTYSVETYTYQTHIHFSFSTHLFDKGIFRKLFSLDSNATVSASVGGEKPFFIAKITNQPTESLAELVETIEAAGFATEVAKV